jgi:3'-phosphoadenosine 5'-phosphosulfate sulfotransferase (PAPS reductase)/FAD synthetase
MSGRTVVWFSCGVTSAVAAKIACTDRQNTVVAYCDTGSEHPDNARFLSDVSAWIGRPIDILRSTKYTDIWDVFLRTRYLSGVRGARCTTELKKMVRRDFQRLDDEQVFGFDAAEGRRVERFREHNPEVNLWAPLFDRGISKSDCLAIIDSAGIAIPEMYRLGYRNNNCIGCPKGQAGYWNKVRVDFPDVFARMAKVERQLDVAICKTEAGGVRRRIFLDELEPWRGRYKSEPPVGCGLTCGEFMDYISDRGVLGGSGDER